MNQANKNFILTIIPLFVLVTQFNCHTEYKNAPEMCGFFHANNQNRLQNDLVLLEKGEITQENFELRKRNREDGTMTLCLMSLIKTKENSNF